MSKMFRNILDSVLPQTRNMRPPGQAFSLNFRRQQRTWSLTTWSRRPETLRKFAIPVASPERQRRGEKLSEQRPTLALIAAEAGVSQATVSKVVNGRSDVAPSTRERIEGLLRSHNYLH
ncbi:LacI family DNA-binding transcriptional regulator, partial [Streptomyces sp. NPDC059956]|uniref:LacI family DNA-binding transcriptional regulator n=1 Tax=Streptomyces sp. NPDC059956 TaxID=3347015 RepID=UPI003662F33F